jgi:hypothetical protein
MLHSVAVCDLRAAAQVALLGFVTPDIRGVSLALDASTRILQFRVYFEAAPEEVVLENMSCVLTEIEAALGPFECIDEDYRVLDVSSRPEHLDIVVYARCESPDLLPPAKPILEERMDAWFDGSAVCVIAIGSCGDPLDLGDIEAKDLVEKIQKAIAESEAS